MIENKDTCIRLQAIVNGWGAVCDPASMEASPDTFLLGKYQIASMVKSCKEAAELLKTLPLSRDERRLSVGSVVWYSSIFGEIRKFHSAVTAISKGHVQVEDTMGTWPGAWLLAEQVFSCEEALDKWIAHVELTKGVVQ